MRIAGNIDHPQFKITIFTMNNRYAVKLERDGLEQTYKFSESHGITTAAEVHDAVDENFIEKAGQLFATMKAIRGAAIAGIQSQNTPDEFDEII